MAKPYWRYASLPNCSVGQMICTVCKKKIEQGAFRYCETDEAYLPQHRACSVSDPAWRRLDVEHKQREAQNSALLADAVAFKAKWNVDALDDLIKDLGKGQP